MPEYTIAITWDSEAQVWCAINNDIPIALESGSFDALIERVKTAVPEVLSLNDLPSDCTLHFVANRRYSYRSKRR